MNTRLAQYPLSYFENMPEVFEPTERDLERGRWAVVFERLDEDGEPEADSNVHTIPLKGKHHLIHESCWCSPSKETCNGGTLLFNHHMSQ